MTVIESAPPITPVAVVPTGADVDPPPFWTAAKAIALSIAMAVLGAGIGFSVANKTQVPKPGAVDVGFVRDMMDHHDQAVEMANIVLSAGSGARPAVVDFARDVITWQRWEEGWMEAWLQEWKLDRAEHRPTAMGWMGMAVAVQQMPGLQSEAKMRRLTVARGPALDRLFLTMMREHHLGGVAMADYAAKWAKLDKVAGLAVTIAKNQRFEIADYERLIATMLIVPMASMINEAPPKP